MKLLTHDMIFHPGDVIAAAILSSIYPDASIIRSRNPNYIEEADIVWDLGKIYDGKKFFAYQGTKETRNNGVRLATAGLIWKHFGFKYCRPLGLKHNIPLEDLVSEMDRLIICGVDAYELGLIDWTPRLKVKGQGKIAIKDLQAIINSVNPVNLVEEVTPEMYDVHFQIALQLASITLLRTLINIVSRRNSERLVLEADTGGPILILPKRCKWKKVVIEKLPHVNFVIYQAYSQNWHVHLVPSENGELNTKLRFPKEWELERSATLAELTGVEDAVFCSAGGTMVGAKTLKGAKQLVQLVLKQKAS